MAPIHNLKERRWTLQIKPYTYALYTVQTEGFTALLTSTAKFYESIEHTALHKIWKYLQHLYQTCDAFGLTAVVELIVHRQFINWVRCLATLSYVFWHNPITNCVMYFWYNRTLSFQKDYFATQIDFFARENTLPQKLTTMLNREWSCYLWQRSQRS